MGDAAQNRGTGLDGDAFHARQIEAMAGYGIPPDDIAQVLRLDAKELRRDYAAQLEDGRIKANSRVAESLFRRATGEGREAVVAAIFWLKTRAGWRETDRHEIESRSEVVTRIELVAPNDFRDNVVTQLAVGDDT